MKTLNVMTLLILVLSVTAQANQGAINDLPHVILTCEETSDDADAIEVTLSRDQFGQTYLTAIQPSTFQPLIENRLLTEKTCQGFVPCELYEAAKGSTVFFVNYLSDSNPAEGHLESSETGPVSLNCNTLR